MTITFEDVLANFRDSAIDKRDLGDKFERLIGAVLREEPAYADYYDNVWLWMDYPGRDGRRDNGIDLVARAKGTGELTAIQCKFFAETTQVTKGMLDSFLSESGKLVNGVPEFAARTIFSTSDNWGATAEKTIEDQTIPVSRVRFQDLAESSIDWSKFSFEKPDVLTRKSKKTPLPHQKTAIVKVREGFASADRGKLIMACGTGKTFTSLKIVEEMVPAGGTALFLVPSIALLSQTLREWTMETTVPLRCFAVCSDVSVGRRNRDEDSQVVDLAFPATTNRERLIEQFTMTSPPEGGITVVFSTYQSIGVVSAAQAEGLPEFDVVICDEAHRTTGVTLAGDDESAFVRVHDQGFLKAKKRLYMTATPRIFHDATVSKATEANAVLADMNDESVFGPEFHRLSFGEAVQLGRLTDYKVVVLAVDEEYVAGRFQSLLADENNELTLDDAAKIIGCWNGLSKRGVSEGDFASDPEPMRRAVAFAKNIAESKKVAAMFEQVVALEIELLEAEGKSDKVLSVQAHHVDGTFNILSRNKQLDWLKADPGENAARILTNAKCLSEGVDVPALDAVMFLNPRDSVVDVVQSVGRVMRKLEGKKFGYVILPIGVPADVDPATALSNNVKYKVVWQVLQALRAHDERFDAEVNKIDLTKKAERIQVGFIGAPGPSSPRAGDSEEGNRNDGTGSGKG